MMKRERPPQQRAPNADPQETAQPGANHRRVLASAYRQLERAAGLLETQLTQELPPHLMLTQMIEEFDPAQQSALLHVLKYIRQEVMTVASQYHFNSQRESRQRAVAAEFAILWSHLEEMRPHRLQAYGLLSVQVAEELAPAIQRAIDLVLTVQAIAQGEPEVIQAWQEENQRESREETHGEAKATNEHC